jgi:hypothetical protein
MTPQMQT